MVNDKTSVALYLDTFNLSDDFNSYTCGHVLKTYEASNKKIEQTVMAIQSRFVYINYNETHNWVDGIIRKYTTVIIQLALRFFNIFRNNAWLLE